MALIEWVTQIQNFSKTSHTEKSLGAFGLYYIFYHRRVKRKRIVCKDDTTETRNDSISDIKRARHKQLNASYVLLFHYERST